MTKTNSDNEMDLDKQLIKEVKNHKVLYDPTHSMYKDVSVKQQIWVDIGKKLMTGNDETASVCALKVRWKSLRDAYVKERKYDMAKNCGVELRYKKPWRLKKQMEFLSPFIHNRKSITSDPVNESNDKNDCAVSETPSEKSGLLKNKKKNNVSVINSTIESEESHKNHKLKRKSVNQSNMNRNEYGIKTDSFFRILSDMVKTLNSNNQILVQKELAMLVMKYKLRELDEEEN